MKQKSMLWSMGHLPVDVRTWISGNSYALQFLSQ